MLVPAALTSQISNGIVDQGKGALQSARVEVEVLDVNAVMAKVNVMNCSGAIFGSACDAKKNIRKSQLGGPLVYQFVDCYTLRK